MTTKMDFERFVTLGFNVNEAKVYVALLTYGRADAKTLIKELKFHKNIVYDNLHKLLNKGVVSSIIQDARTIFFAEPPSALIDYIRQKEESLAEQRKQVTALTKEIEQLQQKTPRREDARIFQGTQGVKRVFHQLYAQATTYIAYGGALDSANIMGDAFWLQSHVIQKEKNISCKLIFNESLRTWMQKNKAYQDQDLRFLEKGFEPLTETMVWNNITAIIVWTQEPIVTVIQNKIVADSNRTFFNVLWKQAKK